MCSGFRVIYVLGKKRLLVKFVASTCSHVSCLVMMLTKTIPCAALSLATAAAIAVRMVYAMCVVCFRFCNTTAIHRARHPTIASCKLQ